MVILIEDELWKVYLYIDLKIIKKFDIKKGIIIIFLVKSFLFEKKIDFYYIDEIVEIKVVVELVKKEIIRVKF